MENKMRVTIESEYNKDKKRVEFILIQTLPLPNYEETEVCSAFYVERDNKHWDTAILFHQRIQAVSNAVQEGNLDVKPLA